MVGEGIDSVCVLDPSARRIGNFAQQAVGVRVVRVVRSVQECVRLSVGKFNSADDRALVGIWGDGTGLAIDELDGNRMRSLRSRSSKLRRKQSTTPRW